MMKVEFERLVGKEVLDEDYEVINAVYEEHPRDFSKEEVATLCRIGGMEVINALFGVVEEILELRQKKDSLLKQIETIDRDLGVIYSTYGRD